MCVLEIPTCDPILALCMLSWYIYSEMHDGT